MTNIKSVENQNLVFDESQIEIFDFEKLEKQLEEQLANDSADYENLNIEMEKIGNPESLGKVISDEIWNQFSNQIGLDITSETLIEKYDQEHPEDYEEVGKRVMSDNRYKEANKEMKRQQQEGELVDAYTGKKINAKDKANLDHVVSRKEIYENKRRRQANIPTEDLANKKENLQPTNEALNKSKNKKSVDEYIAQREEREKSLREQNERANKKIDESNMSAADKKKAKEENNKRLQDKLAADDKLMKEADEKARSAINRDIAIGVTKEIGKKASIDALKQMSIEALFTLLKEIIKGLVRFFKTQAKNLQSFFSEMKEALHRFFNKITNFLQTGAKSFIGTVISEIVGPIINTVKKISSLLKQGVSTVWDAIKYMRDPSHRDEPFSIKVAQVTKIIVGGLTAIGAIFGGELFEKALLTIPGMQTPLPLIGTLASIIGVFLSSLVSGIIGAMVLNVIDKYIAKKRKDAMNEKIYKKANDILITQLKLRFVLEENTMRKKENVSSSIAKRHAFAQQQMYESLNNINKNRSEAKNAFERNMNILKEINGYKGTNTIDDELVKKIKKL